MGVFLIIIPAALLFALLIVPRQRELRRHVALVGSLAVGDEVMTGSGVYGTIADLTEDYVYLEVAPGVTIKIARRAVASRVEDPQGPTHTTPATGAAEQPDRTED